MLKERPSFVVVPNLPDRGVAQDMSWLASSLPAEQVAKLQAAAVDRPEAQAFFAHPSAQPRALEREGVQDRARHRRQRPVGGAPRDGRHGRDRHDAGAGHRGVDGRRAEFMRLTDAGTVAPGKAASFIVLDANPLDDITNTRRIRDVYLRGEHIDRSAY